MTDLEILRLHTDELFRLIQQHGDIYEQIKAVKDILKDVQGEIRIETTSINGSERISKIDVAPTSITLFQEFNLTSPHIDASFIALSRLYTAYLWCNKTGNCDRLYDSLLNYERATHYPITRCSKDDIDTLMTEASCIIDSTLVQPESSNDGMKITNIFPSLFK